MRLWLVAVAACGSSPPPAKPIRNTPPAVATVSCADAGVILRGAINTGDAKAGPARESAIARACTDDKWAPALLACVGNDRTPIHCLEKLEPQQNDNFQAKLDLWASQYPDDGYGGDPSTEREAFVDCSEVVGDVTRFAPPFDVEHDWQIAARKKLIENACNADSWEEDVKECVIAATGIPGTSGCIPDPALTAKLTELDAVARKIAAAKKQPATLTCAKVVATHYADARWKDHPKTAAKDRKASRTEMQKVCTAEAWTETERACIVVDDQARCYENAQRWGYPALVTAKVAGMSDECSVYKAAMDRLIACDALPRASRDAMRDAFAEASKMWTNLAPAEAQQMAPICKAGVDSMLNAFPQCGGW